jgi:hypothetical protein
MEDGAQHGSFEFRGTVPADFPAQRFSLQSDLTHAIACCMGPDCQNRGIHVAARDRAARRARPRVPFRRRDRSRHWRAARRRVGVRRDCEECVPRSRLLYRFHWLLNLQCAEAAAAAAEPVYQFIANHCFICVFHTLVRHARRWRSLIVVIAARSERAAHRTAQRGAARAHARRGRRRFRHCRVGVGASLFFCICQCRCRCRCLDHFLWFWIVLVV